MEGNAVRNFIFQNPTKIIFGKGVETGVGKETQKYSKKVLLHYGGGSIKKSGLYDTVTHSLKESGVEYLELSGVKSNPRLSLVKEGIRICRENSIGLILAAGGGSVIDSAKAIALGVPYNGDVWDFYTGKAKPAQALPIGTVLTIPAAGSESSTGSVITNEEGWYKRSCDSSLIYPRFSFLNPEIAYTLPKYQIACGASDIIAHIMERYFTNTQNVELTDRLLESACKTIINNAPIILQKQNEYNAWSEVMWTGALANNNLLDTGRETDWASHAIEHELSGIYDIAHGAGLSIIFPAWMQYVYKQNIARFAQFASRIWNVDYSLENPEWSAEQGIKRYKEFLSSLGMPVSLKEAGISDDRLMEMAQKATNGDTKTLGNFMKLNKNDIYEIFKLAC